MSLQVKAIVPHGADTTQAMTGEVIGQGGVTQPVGPERNPQLRFAAMIAAMLDDQARDPATTAKVRSYLQGQVGSVWYDLPSDVFLSSRNPGSDSTSTNHKRNLIAVGGSTDITSIGLFKHFPFHDTRMKWLSQTDTNTRTIAMTVRGK